MWRNDDLLSSRYWPRTGNRFHLVDFTVPNGFAIARKMTADERTRKENLRQSDFINCLHDLFPDGLCDDLEAIIIHYLPIQEILADCDLSFQADIDRFIFTTVEASSNPNILLHSRNIQ